MGITLQISMWRMLAEKQLKNSILYNKNARKFKFLSVELQLTSDVYNLCDKYTNVSMNISLFVATTISPMGIMLDNMKKSTYVCTDKEF